MSQFTTFAGWRSAVESHTIRTDFPTTVYSLAQEEIYERLRVAEMRTTTTITADSEEEALPSDFIEPIHAYIDTGGIRYTIDFQDEYSKDVDYDSTGIPQRAVVVSRSFIRFNPVPDGSYTVNLRYYAKPTYFSDDSDTNSVLSAYNRVFLWGALKQFAIWQHDVDMTANYETLLSAAIMKANSRDMGARYGTGPLRSRARSHP